MESKNSLIGTVLLAVGFAILLFSYVYFMTRPKAILSPVPYERPPVAVPKNQGK